MRSSPLIHKKVIGIVVPFALLASGIAAYIGWWTTVDYSRQILSYQAEFNASLLADNLAVAMQARSLDSGAALQTTLHLVELSNSKVSAIQRIAVFDSTGVFVCGLNEKNTAIVYQGNVTPLQVYTDNVFRIRQPLIDMTSRCVGYAEIDFTMNFLHEYSRRSAMSGAITCIVIFVILFSLTLIAAQRMARTPKQ